MNYRRQQNRIRMVKLVHGMVFAAVAAITVTLLVVSACTYTTSAGSQVIIQPTDNIESSDEIPTTSPTVIIQPTTAPTIEPTVEQVEQITTAPTETVEETVPTEPEVEETEWVPNEEDVIAIAKTLWGECRGVPYKSHQAAVAWCILNRLDSGKYGSTVLKVVSAPNQFVGYNKRYPVTDELRELAIDVLTRWHAEKEGQTDVGRVLPADYYYFSGYKGLNYFRNLFNSSNYWDWSLPSPYES